MAKYSNAQKQEVTNKVIGQRIRAQRRAKSITQEDLAERCSLSTSQLQQYEFGTARMSASLLLEVADALELNVGEFFTPDCRPSSYESTLEDRKAEAINMINASRSLSSIQTVLAILQSPHSQK